MQGLPKNVLNKITARLEAKDLINLACLGCGLENNEEHWEALFQQEYPRATYLMTPERTWKQLYCHTSQVHWIQERFFEAVTHKSIPQMGQLWLENADCIFYPSKGDGAIGYEEVIESWENGFRVCPDTNFSFNETNFGILSSKAWSYLTVWLTNGDPFNVKIGYELCDGKWVMVFCDGMYLGHVAN